MKTNQEKKGMKISTKQKEEDNWKCRTCGQSKDVCDVILKVVF